MSLNQLFSKNNKTWLDISVKNIKIDNDFFIPNILGNVGEYFQIVNGKAEWGPLNLSYNNAIIFALPISQSLSSSFVSNLVLGSPLTSFNASLFSYDRGLHIITVLKTGIYYVYSNITTVQTGGSLESFIILNTGSGLFNVSASNSRAILPTESSTKGTVISSCTLSLTVGDQISFRVIPSVDTSTIGSCSTGVLYLAL